MLGHANLETTQPYPRVAIAKLCAVACRLTGDGRPDTAEEPSKAV